MKRLIKEAEYKEELFNNHGKDANFFKAPVLGTAKVNTDINRFKNLVAESEKT